MSNKKCQHIFPKNDRQKCFDLFMAINNICCQIRQIIRNNHSKLAKLTANSQCDSQYLIDHLELSPMKYLINRSLLINSEKSFRNSLGIVLAALLTALRSSSNCFSTI